MKVALAGNPNCGKTTLFNILTGSNQYVGNWPGVTVEKKEGFFDLGGRRIRVVDLPGIYALTAASEDERVAISQQNSIYEAERILQASVCSVTAWKWRKRRKSCCPLKIHNSPCLAAHTVTQKREFSPAAHLITKCILAKRFVSIPKLTSLPKCFYSILKPAEDYYSAFLRKNWIRSKPTLIK